MVWVSQGKHIRQLCLAFYGPAVMAFQAFGTRLYIALAFRRVHQAGGPPNRATCIIERTLPAVIDDVMNLKFAILAVLFSPDIRIPLTL